MKHSPTNQNDNVSFNPFEGPSIKKIIHTTPSQSEIWLACKFGGEDANKAYNESITLVLNGELNKIALEGAIASLLERHEALRSTFSADGAFMTIYEDVLVAPIFNDISKNKASEKKEILSKYLINEAHYNFDLLKGPLIKFGLIKLNDNEHHLVISAHHIICDGWSMGTMLYEISTFYNSNINKSTPNIPAPETFSSYADDQLDFIESEDFVKTQNFWIKQYETSVPMVSLPTDYPRPTLRTFKSDQLNIPLDNNLVENLKKVGIQSRASFVVTLMTAFEIFLYFQTDQEDLVLGLPAAGQSMSGKSQLIGHCVNLLPLRSKISPNTPFNTYLKHRKEEIFDAYEYQQFSFGQLLQKLNIARDPSRVPLVPVIFNIDMGMSNDVTFDNLNFNLKSNPRAYEVFELFLNATGTKEKLILEWSYNASLFKETTIKQMMTSFEAILQAIVDNPSIKIGDIVKTDTTPYLELNNTETEYPQLTMQELITKQSKKTPLRTALKFGDHQITYEDLEKKACQMAHHLTDQGLNSGHLVAVLLPRSIELVATLIAIMKCGSAYLPLDPNFPNKRLEFMLEDSEAKYIITSKTLPSEISTKATSLFLEDIIAVLPNYPDTPITVELDNNSTAYLLYTSGSTGKPKGVAVSHKSLVNVLHSVINKPGIQETDTLLSITTISFDISVAELFAPLLTGAKLVLTDEETAKDTRILLDVIKNEQITMMQATPATWQMLLDSGWEDHLPIRAISTGEALSLGLANKILKRVNELWNLYGPTETTIWSSISQILETDDAITIGRPVANTKLYIVNGQGDLVSQGKTGELCIGGDGVAKGYWKRPNLTTDKFIKNHFETDLEAKLYRTGDLAKLMPSGDIMCLGRIDNQVKIRGQRIDLGEIEESINALEDVQNSLVMLNNDVLIAHIISSEIENQDTRIITEWKSKLKEQLPAHMIPQHFNFLKEFPLSPNGKIDRKALLNYSNTKVTSKDFNEASTPSEKIILAIWKECLALDKIDINSDYFEIGGHSLVGVKVMAKLEKETGNRLPLVTLLKHSTIKELAAYMDSEFFTWGSLVPLKPEGTKPPLYIVHGANHQVLIFNELAQQLDKDQPVYGLQSRGLNGISEPHDSIDDMAADYIAEIIASNPEGPYALAGFSYGGIVAYEMARQLKAQGRKVTILAQFDTYVFPDYYYSKPFQKKIISKLYLLGKIGYLLLNMFSSKKNFHRRIELIKLQIKGLKLRLKHGKTKQYEMQFNVSSKLPINHNIATSNYTITPQDIIIDLFRAKEEVNFVHDHKLLGWKKMALKGIRKHMVPGNHVDMFEKHNAKDFAASLQHVLDHYNSEEYE
jgi:amino acid adenylation domain-containing protein